MKKGYRSKKAFVDIDWAMSLSIFLLYIAWFFFYLSSNPEPQNEMNGLMYVVDQGIENEFYWEVSKYPLFVQTEIEAKNEPIIVDFPFAFNKSKFTITPPVNFDIDSGKLFFISDLKYGQNTFEIITSRENYENYETTYDLNVESDYVTTINNSYRTFFYKAMISDIYYDDFFNIQNVKYYLNEFEFLDNLTKSTSHNKSQIVSWHKSNNDYFNSKTYIFGGKSRSIVFIEPSSEVQNISLIMNMEIPKVFNSYFGNNINFGSVDLNSSNCYNFNWSYLDLYNSRRGISFIFNDSVEYNFCVGNFSINLNITIPITEIKYEIISHDGGFLNTLNYTTNIKTRYGLKTNIKGIDLDKMDEYNKTTYATIKSQWGYPDDKDFNFIIMHVNDTNIQSVEYSTPAITDNVYVREIYDHILLKNSTKEKVKILVQIW